MKFSESWLCEYVSLDTTTEELIARLTMAGLEVDGTESAAADFSGVVVARVESTKAHPQADKLKVCEVDVGTQENLQVVCGAPNVQPGMKVPLAMVGASLPDLVVKQAELRGVASSGMLCSAAELGLSEDNSGLFELPEGATLGADLRDYLGLEDTIIEVDLTPNRGDCLSLQGLAREAAVLFQTDFTLPDFNAPDDQTDKLIPVRL
ncbi:MAG TPA: phenylalanine--tRNA ligase subunit beta, partial [Porticoccaceae bacterium]|nr:phenylalanine--tRNA ligase subunit beta [Porticoccaceae bacterium]